MTEDVLARLKQALQDRYSIERELGSGGMAAVYLAEDLKHHRKVALKVMRPELSAILGGERFLREIRIAAKLNHPHILALHDSGEADGFLFYVMPHVEGESLRAKLEREKQLSVDEAISITKQVGAALDYAHEQGVIHRDIKPENILIHQGEALVADFGIALAIRTAGGTRLTDTGLSLGTPEYMSPEQATGDRELDARSDVYSLGATTYEMLVGEPPHTGNSVQAIIAKVVSVEPQPVSRVRHSVPSNVDAAVICALAKTPADRFASGADFLNALRNPDFRTAVARGALPEAAGQRSWNRLSIGFGGLAALLAVLAVWGWFGRGPAGSIFPEFRMVLAPEDVTVIAAAGGDPLAFSPDGRTVAFIGRGSSDDSQAVYVRDLGDYRPRRLAHTSGAAAVFFSPDGEWVGFKVGRELSKIPLEGGAPVHLASDARNQRGTASWGPDGTIVYTTIGNPQMMAWVGENGELLESLLPPDWEGIAQWPTYTPNGRGIVLQVCETSDCVEDLGIHVLDLRNGEVRPLVDEATRGWVLPSGYLLYSREDGAALAAPFDLEALELTGPAIPVLENVQTGIDRVGRIAVSNMGHIVYIHGTRVERRELVRVSRTGEIQPLPIVPRAFGGVRVSPDGSRLVTTVRDELGVSIWIQSLDGASQSRLFTPGGTPQPTWMPGGSSVAFVVPDTTGLVLAMQTVDLSGPPRTIARLDSGYVWGVSPNPDGSSLYFGFHGPDTEQSDLFVVSTDGASEPEVVLQTAASELYPVVSADGRWLAYRSDESGMREVYVRRVDGTGGREPVSSGGAQEHIWSKTDSELFYRGADGLYSAVITEQNGIQVTRRRLFDDSELSRAFTAWGSGITYDVDPTGEHFIMIRNPSETDARLHVVLNFAEELKRKVGQGNE